MTPAEHKKLVVKQQELKEAIKLNRKRQQETDTLITNLADQLSKVESDLAKPVDIIISEHAILRYLERVQGMDMKELHEQIKEEFGLGAIAVKDGEYKLNVNGWRLVLKENTLVTIEPTRGK